MRWLDAITNSMDTNLGKLQEMVRMEKPGVSQSTGSPRVGHNFVTEQQQNYEFSKKYVHILFHVNCRPTSP